MERILNYVLVLIVLLAVGACQSGNQSEKTSSVGAEPLVVFTAASLSEVLTEIADSFMVKYHVPVRLNFASSGTLARQIEQGHGAGVFISASKKWAEYIDSLGLTKKGTIQEVASNRLVVIAPVDFPHEIIRFDSSFSIAKLIGNGRLSMGDPSHVPAGKYAQQMLEFYGWDDDLEGKLLPAKDVRSALMVVELGEVPLGIVYKTDAAKSSKVSIIAEVPSESHSPIVYVSSVCAESETAMLFNRFVNSAAMVPIWEKSGFSKCETASVDN